ncbi:hypothetical protein CPB84DRAFT_224139 [Gymnopilus junonius]|uniref:Carbohydrate-binding module family 19 domain-containing protein n=1 Tax=Gymnopilus junonius TaxID=109634 RepID=A0A9P5NGH0_GYMJU|nr:hypothetical protein CPB84DRAFT_224139 [Gymnopilus junonius]
MPSKINCALAFSAIFSIVNSVQSAPTFQARDDGYGSSASNAAIIVSSSVAATTSATSAAASNHASVTATIAATPASTPSLDGSVPDFVKQNGLAAQKLNLEFSNLTATDSCQTEQMACIQGQFAQCVSGKWILSPCGGGLTCFALPNVNKNGTSLICDNKTMLFSASKPQVSPEGLMGPIRLHRLRVPHPQTMTLMLQMEMMNAKTKTTTPPQRPPSLPLRFPLNWPHRLLQAWAIPLHLLSWRQVINHRSLLLTLPSPLSSLLSDRQLLSLQGIYHHHPQSTSVQCLVGFSVRHSGCDRPFRS